MKRILLLICLFTSVLSAGNITFVKDSLSGEINQKIKDDLWLGRDKAQHLIGSFLITGISKLSFQKFYRLKSHTSLAYAVSITFTVSTLKEIFDASRNDNYFSFKDLGADFTGIIFAVLVFQ